MIATALQAWMWIALSLTGALVIGVGLTFFFGGAEIIDPLGEIKDPKTDPEIKVVCNWYHEERFISGNPQGTKVSHGCCDECSARFEHEAKV